MAFSLIFFCERLFNGILSIKSVLINSVCVLYICNSVPYITMYLQQHKHSFLFIEIFTRVFLGMGFSKERTLSHAKIYYEMITKELVKKV